MPRSSRTFRVFISSTFSDFGVERDALRDSVYPRLRDLCESRGYQFQAVDLRWGVSEQASKKHKTMCICLEELRRCQHVSPRPNFLVLLGNRYGWRPLPEEIALAEFNLLKPHLDEKAFRKIYQLDENNIPPVFVQQRDPGACDGTRSLHRTLQSAADQCGWNRDDSAKFWASATHQEAIAGVLAQPDASSHVHVFRRTIENLDDLTDELSTCESARDQIDVDSTSGTIDNEAQQLLKELAERLEHQLGNNVHNYSVSWHPEFDKREVAPLPDDLDECLRLLDPGSAKHSFCIDVWRSLASVILDEIAAMDAQSKSVLEDERHQAVARSLTRHGTHGREAELRKIRQFQDHGNGANCLVVCGPPGCGKSTLLAQAATSNDMRAVVRFIGATHESSNGYGVLSDVCNLLAEQDPCSDFNAVAERFCSLLEADHGEPLTVFVDGLDLLPANDAARRLAWVPARDGSGNRLILSVQEGPLLETLQRLLPAECFLHVAKLSPCDGELLLESFLTYAGRTLTLEQRRLVLDRFSRNGTPLFLRMAGERFRFWSSFGPVGDLPVGSAEIAEMYFSQLEAQENHGRELVRYSLSYLQCARYGLTEPELLELLSGNSIVMDEFRKRFPDSPPTNDLPSIIWSRLRFDLDDYLMVRDCDGHQLLTFYDRAVRQAVQTRYLHDEAAIDLHREMGKFFSAKLSLGDIRSAAYQRALQECVHHHVYADDADKAVKRLLDFRYLRYRIGFSGLQSLLSDYSILEQTMLSEEQSNAIRLVRGALLTGQRGILRYPNELISQLHAHLHDAPLDRIQSMLREARKAASDRWLSARRIASCRRAGQFRLDGHERTPMALARLIDGPLASVSKGGRFRFWDLDSRQSWRSPVDGCGSCLVASPCARFAIGGTRDGDIVVWAANGAERIRTHLPDSSRIKALAACLDHVVVLSDDSLYVWRSDAEEWNPQMLANAPDAVYEHPETIAALCGWDQGIAFADESRVYRWDLSKPHPNPISELPDTVTLASSRGGDLFAGLADGTVWQWQFDDDPNASARQIAKHGDRVRALDVCMHPALLAVGDEGGVVSIYDWSGSLISELTRSAATPQAVMFTKISDSLVLVMADESGAITVCPIENEDTAGARRITTVAMSANRLQPAVGDVTGVITFHDDCCSIAHLIAPASRVTALAYNPEATQLAAATANGTVAVWNISEEDTPQVLYRHRGEVSALGYLSRDTLVGVTDDDHFLLGDPAGGSPVRTFALGDAHCNAVASLLPLPPHGLVTGGIDGSIAMWKIGETIEMVWKDQAHSAEVCALAATAGMQLSASADGVVRLCDCEWRVIRELPHAAIVSGADFLEPNLVVTSAEDGTIRIWQTDGELVAAFTVNQPLCACVAAGGRIVVGDWDGNVWLLEVRPKTLGSVSSP